MLPFAPITVTVLMPIYESLSETLFITDTDFTNRFCRNTYRNKLVVKILCQHCPKTNQRFITDSHLILNYPSRSNI